MRKLPAVFQVCFIVLYSFFSVNLSAQTTYLIPYRDGNLWGYADTNLNIIIKPEYSEVSGFVMEYAQVRKEKFWGVLNVKGEEIIPAIYEVLKDCCAEYTIAVKDSNEAIIEVVTGKVLLPLNNRSIEGLYGQFYKTGKKNAGKGLFDAAKQKWLLPEVYGDILFEGINDYGTLYIAKRKGNDIRFALGGKGFSIVKDNSKKPYASAVISKAEPKPVSEEEELLITNQQIFDMAGYYKRDGKLGIYYQVTQGEMRTIDSMPPVFDTLKPVKGSSNLMIVRKDGKEGIISASGKMIMPFIYDEVEAVDSTVSHGIYIVKLGEKYGLANTDKLLLPCVYEGITASALEIKGFYLKQGNKEGCYIYDTGRKLLNVIIPALYDNVWGIVYFQAADFDRSIEYDFINYKNGKFLVNISKDGKRGYIDLNGKEFFRN